MQVLVSPEFIVVFSLISWFALGPLPTQAALRYVDPENGSDVRGDATKENPVKTIDKALDFAKTGDTLFLESGSFSSVVLPKALGIWGNSLDKATIQGPVSFNSSVTTMVDLHFRDLIVTGSEGFVFDSDISMDGVTFDNLELQISGSDSVFIGGKGQLNVTGAGLTFDSLQITQSGSGSSSALDINVDSGPIILTNISATGNNNALSFNIGNSPNNIQVTNVTFSNKAQLSISNPVDLLVSQCAFINSGLSISGGSGTIEQNSFSQITADSVIDFLAPTTANAAIDFTIMNNTFQSVYKGLDLSSLNASSSITILFHNNDFHGANKNTDGIRFLLEGMVVDARNNWFGSSTGPYDYLCNPDGQGATVHASGEKVVDNILYRPWCSNEDCSVLITQRSACAAGDDPASYIQDEADSMSPWGMSILIIAVCSVSYLVFVVIFFFAFKLRQASKVQHIASDQEKLT